MIKIKLIFILGISSILFNSCSEYQKVLKSTDLDYKFEQAVKLFDDEEYIKAFPLFDELLLLFLDSFISSNSVFEYLFC